MDIKIIRKLRSFIESGSERTINAKKNIIWMLFVKSGNILIGLLLVPLTLHYVDNATYGLWLTLSSMVAWISFFDIGINNGLKNRLTEAIAHNDMELGRKYVSTTYALLMIIFVPLMIVLLILVPILDWENILNIHVDDYTGLVASISIIVCYFCINFILSTINIVLLADQKPADAAFRSFIQQAITLVIIYVLILTTDGTLVNLCLALCAAPILVVLIFNVTLFRGRYRIISPSFKCIDFKVAPDLFKLGIQFFIIQIASIIQFQMVNFLIIRYYGPEDVTSYNIAYKYFSVAHMIWSILTTPLWAASADAFARNDFAWIRNVQKKYSRMFCLFAVVLVIMLLVSDPIYHLWVGDTVKVEFFLSLWVMLYMLTIMFGSTFVLIINGSGQLKIQTTASLISPIVFLGVFFICLNLQYGVYSVLIASIIANFNGIILAPIQCKKLLNDTVV